MSDTYKAVEVTAPGTLRVVERPIRKPGAGQVRIRVEACGICHSDVLAVEGLLPNAESFSVLQSIRPMIETVPLEQAADAYARMMQGKPRFRMVLVTGAPVHRP